MSIQAGWMDQLPPPLDLPEFGSRGIRAAYWAQFFEASEPDGQVGAADDSEVDNG